LGNDYYDRLSERLYAAVLSDVLDGAGYRGQALEARITHSTGPEVLVGRAATMLAGEEVEVEGTPYARQVEAIDALAEGEEGVVSAALEKVGKEDRVREELAGGATLAEAWARHRVL